MPPLHSPCYIGRWKNAWFTYNLLHITLGMAPCRLTCTSVQTTWPKQNFCIIMAHAEFLVHGYQIYQRQWHSDSWDSCRLRHPCENKFMHIWLDILGILHTSKSDRIANCQFANTFKGRSQLSDLSADSIPNWISLCTHASPGLIPGSLIILNIILISYVSWLRPTHASPEA